MAYIRSKSTGRINVVEPADIELFLLNPDIELIEVINGVMTIDEKPIEKAVEEKRKVTEEWTKKEIIEYLRELGINVNNPMMKKKEELIKLIN